VQWAGKGQFLLGLEGGRLAGMLVGCVDALGLDGPVSVNTCAHHAPVCHMG
jgi:hypothetical protein